PARPVRGLAAVRALPSGTRRADRPGRDDPVQGRPGLHRPAHHRPGHDRAQGHLPVLLPAPSRHDPDRPSHPRRGRLRRRGERPRHPHRDRRRGPARPRPSCLQSGQAIPGGQRWHGTPAEPTTTDYRTVPPARCGTLRRFLFGATQLLTTLTLAVPLAIGGGYLVATRVPALAKIIDGRPSRPTEAAFYLDALALSGVLFFGTLIAGLLFVVTVPRLLGLV